MVNHSIKFLVSVYYHASILHCKFTHATIGCLEKGTKTPAPKLTAYTECKPVQMYQMQTHSFLAFLFASFEPSLCEFTFVLALMKFT